MPSDFERLICDFIDEAADNEEMPGNQYRLTKMLLSYWRARGLVETARLIVAMDEWRQRSDGSDKKCGSWS